MDCREILRLNALDQTSQVWANNRTTIGYDVLFRGLACSLTCCRKGVYSSRSRATAHGMQSRILRAPNPITLILKLKRASSQFKF